MKKKTTTYTYNSRSDEAKIIWFPFTETSANFIVLLDKIIYKTYPNVTVHDKGTYIHLYNPSFGDKA